MEDLGAFNTFNNNLHTEGFDHLDCIVEDDVPSDTTLDIDERLVQLYYVEIHTGDSVHIRVSCTEIIKGEGNAVGFEGLHILKQGILGADGGSFRDLKINL